MLTITLETAAAAKLCGEGEDKLGWVEGLVVVIFLCVGLTCIRPKGCVACDVSNHNTVGRHGCIH